MAPHEGPRLTDRRRADVISRSVYSSADPMRRVTALTCANNDHAGKKLTRSTLVAMHRLSIVLLLAACGGTDTPPPSCTGSSCSCPALTSCDIGNSGCSGSSCTLSCSDHNDCSGTCGASCSVDCKQGSTCDITVGASGSMSCDANSDCTLRCNGSCSLTCATGSTCHLQCASDSAPRSVVEGGSCS